MCIYKTSIQQDKQTVLQTAVDVFTDIIHIYIPCNIFLNQNVYFDLFIEVI